jgi:beta-glucosidase
MGSLVFLFAFILNIHLILTAPPSLSSFDSRVNDLLSKMTDEEKVGQMTQITINLILKDPAKPWNEIEVDPVKLATAIQDFKVGSILNVAETGAYELSQWQNITRQVQDEAKKSRLSVPVLYGIDSIHGASYIRNAVLFPQATGLAATFNVSLARELGKIVAHQTRAAGIPWSFHPQVDIG